MKIRKYYEGQVVEYDELTNTTKIITTEKQNELNKFINAYLATPNDEQINLLDVNPPVTDGLLYLSSTMSTYTRKPGIADLPLASDGSLISVPLPRVVFVVDDYEAYIAFESETGNRVPQFLSNIYDDEDTYYGYKGRRTSFNKVCLGSVHDSQLHRYDDTADKVLQAMLANSPNDDLSILDIFTRESITSAIRLMKLTQQINDEQINTFLKDFLETLVDRGVAKVENEVVTLEDYSMSNYDVTLIALSELNKLHPSIIYSMYNNANSDGYALSRTSNDSSSFTRTPYINTLITEIKYILDKEDLVNE